MTEATITPGGARDGWVWASVNGNEQWIKAGEPTALEPGVAEVLTNAHIPYSIMIDGEEVAPTIFLDFKNGSYTVDGVAVALTEVVGQDVEFGTYAPTDVQAGVGLVGPTNPVVTGAPLDLILAGSTMVVTFVFATSNSGDRLGIDLIDGVDYNTDYYSVARSFDDAGVFQPLRIGDNASEVSDLAGIGAGTHKQALTMINGKIARSVDGGTVSAINPAMTWSTLPALFLMDLEGAVTIESIGIYPPQADAELPSLSAL